MLLYAPAPLHSQSSGVNFAVRRYTRLPPLLLLVLFFLNFLDTKTHVSIAWSITQCCEVFSALLKWDLVQLVGGSASLS
jgi:hypothetical protein